MNNNPLESQNAYQEYVDKKTPNSPILKNCFNAFWVRRFNLCHWTNYF